MLRTDRIPDAPGLCTEPELCQPHSARDLRRLATVLMSLSVNVCRACQNHRQENGTAPAGFPGLPTCPGPVPPALKALRREHITMSAVQGKGTSVGKNCSHGEGRQAQWNKPSVWKKGTRVPNPVLPPVSLVVREGALHLRPVSSTPLEGKCKNPLLCYQGHRA